jgi:hypothetical protein
VSGVRRTWLGLALAAAVAVLAGSVALVAGAAGQPARRLPGAAGTGGYGAGGGFGAGAGYGADGGFGADGYGAGGGYGGMLGRTGMGGAAGMMNGAAGMVGSVWLAGPDTPVTSIAAARQRAAAAATPAGLHPGEVIWFDNGFYVELKDATGAPATEVIVDPTTGTVSTEPGPAMMWNTRYGWYRTGTTPAAVSPARARQIATGWVEANLPGRRVQPPDAFPGYYTLETTGAGGTVNGMLSVNAGTGRVWYHSWHGAFIAREDS